MNRAAASARTRTPRQRALALAAMVLGLCLLIAATLLWTRGTHQPPPYQYTLGSEVPATELGHWSSLADENTPVREAEVADANGRLLAKLEIAETRTGPTLVSWQPTIDPPFINFPPPQADITALAPVLGRHVAADEPVLAWWDSSRQLALLMPARYSFPDHLGIPAFLPPQWSTQRGQIEQVETDFWGARPDAAEAERFQRFVHALAADEATGMAELRALAGGRKAVLILHARDVLLLGQMLPDRIGVAMRDFADTGNVHKTVPQVKDWLRRNNYPAYTVVHPDEENVVRALALTDAESGQTLAARLLPFIGNDQSPVAGALLVYKAGGFWVYELDAEAPDPSPEDPEPSALALDTAPGH